MAGAASPAVEDEWELCNDEGFIYKRRKRAQPEESIPFASSSAQPHAADPETELKGNRLARRKLSLTALRDRYRWEIQQWEVLVASLQDGGRGGSDCYSGVGGGCNLLHLAMEETAGQDGAVTGAASTIFDNQESGGISHPENPFHALVGELMCQVETQGTLLKKLSDICDVVDSACDLREEVITESLLDLPVWGTPPRSLMSSLAD